MSRDVGPARGVLRADAVDGEFQHARRAPSAALESIVQHYWSVRWDLGDGPPQQRETLPHPNVHLVVERDRCRIWGVHRERFTTTLDGRGEVFGIKFRVGGFRALLDVPVSRLRDRSLPLDAVFGTHADGFAEAVLAEPSDAGPSHSPRRCCTMHRHRTTAPVWPLASSTVSPPIPTSVAWTISSRTGR